MYESKLCVQVVLSLGFLLYITQDICSGLFKLIGVSPINCFTCSLRRFSISCFSVSNSTLTSSNLFKSTAKPFWYILAKVKATLLVNTTVSINSAYSTVFSFLYISSDNCCVACKSADKYSDNSFGGISATENPFLKYSFKVSCFCVANSYLSAHASRDNAFLTPHCRTYSPNMVSNTGPV